jgi:hypothetical protein
MNVNIKKINIFLKGDMDEDLGSFEVNYDDYKFLSDAGVDVIAIGINNMVSMNEGGKLPKES